MTGRAIVAGSSGGIGGACADRLEAAGWQVLGTERGSGDEPSTDRRLYVDVTRPGMAEQAVETAERQFGGVDGVVNAIGMSGRRYGDGPVTECTDEGWDEVLRVNLGSAFRLLRAGLPALKRSGGGSVALIGSVLGYSTDPDFVTAAYAASKGALSALARSAAREGAAYGVRVNVVAVGLTRTPMAQRAADDPHIQSRLPELQPLTGQMLEPEDIAGTVEWLLSDASSRVTGAVVPVDSGWLL